ncbi:MAG: hypothetical protein AUI61_01430 [Thaumarchaeota archaeon 13_1_40CM_2_39_13_2]|nr:MAG: hypothetical protein AUI61_01430 [Thaumarchaeota archaeon 13_1_40CM_2_39_13_2]
MATRKGIVVTAIVLVAISAASFVIWIVPQNRGSSFVVSDYKSELESVRERQTLIATEMESGLKELLDKTLPPDDFVTRAQTSSAQVTSLITELIESNPPIEWRESYLNYDESLKKYNEYLTESISLAKKMKGGISLVDLNEEISKIDSLKKESNSLVRKSNETRP